MEKCFQKCETLESPGEDHGQKRSSRVHAERVTVLGREEGGGLARVKEKRRELVGWR